MNQTNSRRRGWAAMLIGVLAASVGFSVMAPAAHAATTPRYKVEAVKFHAYHADYDPWFSDEVFWVFSSVGAAGTAGSRASHEFGDVDSGETRYFSGSEKCVFRTNCLSGTAGNGIGVSIQAWEKDSGSISQTLNATADAFKTYAGILTNAFTSLPYYISKWLSKVTNAVTSIVNWLANLISNENDLIGSRSFVYSPSYLASRIPSVGQSFTENRYFGGTDYSLTLRVTRVA